MTGFFQELKRRKVYRVAVAYVIAAGGIIQIASAIFPAWELPSWALRLTVVLLLIGFPPALLLAWAFDVTPEGIQTTPSITPDHGSELARRHRRRNVTLLVGSGVLLSAIAGFFLLPHAAATKMEKSIAVLPFENFSDKTENAYFADGIQDDILTNLSKIGDLKVISRTSVMPYRGKQKSVREIGKELGVGAILEGSVRREANRVRVNVQLINAENDHHIWAEDYDRELTDVFAIQTDLAQKIARELQAQLSPTEKAEITHKPTENGEAYLAFVQAHNLQSSLEDQAKLKQAVQLYQRAIGLDPKFVLAYANLSMLHSWIFHYFEPTDAERDLAKKYADEALDLAPDSPEAHLARGYWRYYGALDYEGALVDFAVAQNGLPNDSEVYLVIGAIQRRQGKWKESTDNLERAVKLNPNDTWPLQNLFFNYRMQRQFDAAERVVDRALRLNPTSTTIWGLKSQLALAARGDLTVTETCLANFEKARAVGQLNNLDPSVVNEVSMAKANVLMVQNKNQEALDVLSNLPVQKSNPQHMVEAALQKAILYRRMGQPEKSGIALQEAKEQLEATLREAPNEPSRHALLARILAQLGEKEKAVAEARRAIELRPESADAFEGPNFSGALAEVYAVNGQNAEAIQVLDHLLTVPSELTVPILRIDPIWQSLRNDPAFQQMLAKHESRA